ncbi:amidase family protein [Natribacillus halophilus]|uniref:Amidase n=1 Tax=Natribacillus halophilus TaxID=549003 RepID=A0A1G8S6I5_9BACI|nr:amidase family protein [Natribacillus halophilus]SDJ24858.1 amidase [Natribacillus halophilus]
MNSTLMADDWHEETSITEIQQAYDEGTLTAKNLVLYYLNRIALWDQDGPYINAVADINPDAIKIAETLDTEREQHGRTGALHGIPILLKESIETADRMATSAGSIVLENWRSNHDAFLVKQLRSAGAIILGKTNMTELAHRVGTQMPENYSSRGGYVLCPYGTQFDVGGSSSGSAAAVASNFAPCSIGTETSGSLLNPATRNSLVTVKPTIGLVSRSGIIPLSYSQDTAGPMTQTVADAAHIMQVIAGRDEQDEATKSRPFHTPNYTDALKKDGVQGKRIGIFRDPQPKLTDQIDFSLYEETIIKLKDLGASLVDSVSIPAVNRDDGDAVVSYECRHSLNNFFARADPFTGFRSFDEFLQSYEDDAHLHKYGYDRLRVRTSVENSLSNANYLISKLRNQGLDDPQSLENVLADQELDAILFPSSSSYDVAARAGLPSISVPAGFHEDGRPFGVTFTGKAFSEETLFQIAYAYEQATMLRQKPNLVP